MGRLRIELLLGDIDGVNDTFTVPVPYQPGTARYFLHGILRYGPDDDGIIESDPAAGEIRVKEPPLPGDRHQLLFEDLFIQGPSFNPIIAFDVELHLSIPAGLECLVLGEVTVPRDLQVEGDVDTAPAIPAGFFVEDSNPAPSIPAGLEFEDLDFVSVPKGIAVNRI